MRVAVVGVGGVGSFAAEVLARAGISLLLIDPDKYESKNTNQRFYSRETEGRHKVDVAAEFLSAFSSVEAIRGRVEEASFSADALLDCTDSRESRKAALNKARELDIPYAFASVSESQGMVSLVETGASFHLLEKKGSTSSGSVAACSLAGTLGAANLLNFLKGKAAIKWPEVLVFNTSPLVFEKVVL